MGFITSRPDWPPKPENNPSFRWVYELVLVDGKWTKRLVKQWRSDDRRKKTDQ
jgi:hypothetical protein